MKAFGTIIIILCFGLNLAIGGFLFNKAFLERPPVNPAVSISPNALVFPEVGLSMEIPAGYEKIEATSTPGLLGVYVQHIDNSAFWPTLQIFAGPDERLWKSITEKQYQDYRAAIFGMNPKVSFIQAGMATTSQGIPVYYDILTEEASSGLYKEKIYIMYVNNKEIKFLWADDPSQFDTSIASFEAIMSTVKKI